MKKILLVWQTITILMLSGFTSGLQAKGDDVTTDSTWYIGFGVASGTFFGSSYEIDGLKTNFEDWTQHDGKFGLQNFANFGIGYMMSPNWRMGLDVAWARYDNSSTFSVSPDLVRSINLSEIFFVTQYFPMTNDLFVRAGAGYSQLARTISLTNNENAAENLEDASNGVGMLVGIGYAFQISKGFSISINLDHRRQYYSSKDNKPDASSYTIAFLGFNWL